MPKTLEEAIAAITKLTQQVEQLTADKNKILKEKKELMEFSDKDRENMSEGEQKLLAVIEQERAARTELENQIKADTEARNKAENERVGKAIEARIATMAKGDSAVADKLRAHVALLEKMPRTTDGELDALAGAAFNMLGTNQPNPLAAANGSSGGGTPNTSGDKRFSETDKGKQLADALGMTFQKPADGEKK